MNVADKAAVVNRLITMTTSDSAPSEEVDTNRADSDRSADGMAPERKRASTLELSYLVAGPLLVLLPQTLHRLPDVLHA